MGDRDLVWVDGWVGPTCVLVGAGETEGQGFAVCVWMEWVMRGAEVPFLGSPPA